MFSNLFLQLIVFFLPTQLGLHFWPDFSRASGIKVDYLSPTIYFLDFLILAYICLTLPKLIKLFKKHQSLLVIYSSFAIFNILVAVSPFNSLLWWLRISFYLLFFFSLRLQKVTWDQVKSPLFWSTLLIIALQIFQLYSQTSQGGIFYWLGERAFSFSTPGLARLDLFGRQIIRTASTFSHPNSLAGYLLVVFYLYSVNKENIWKKLIVLLGLLITFSKAALLALVIITIFRQQYIFLIYIFLGFSFLQVFSVSFSTPIQFISDRIFLLSPIKKIFLGSPFGVGLGNFIPALSSYLPGSFLLPSKLQPVHNIPLLAITEIGLPGVALMAWMTKKNIRRILKPTLLGLITIIIITGAFDHYWWTLPQNRLILILATAILL